MLPATIQLFTIQMAQWRLAKTLDIKFIDITAKSGLQPFAPEMSNVFAYKKGTMDEATYTRIYLEEMELSKINFPRHWETLKLYPRMAFACYCPKDAFCHRHLFVDVVKKHLEEQGVEVKMEGEIVPTTERRT